MFDVFSCCLCLIKRRKEVLCESFLFLGKLVCVPLLPEGLARWTFVRSVLDAAGVQRPPCWNTRLLCFPPVSTLLVTLRKWINSCPDISLLFFFEYCLLTLCWLIGALPLPPHAHSPEHRKLIGWFGSFVASVRVKLEHSIFKQLYLICKSPI